MDRCPVCNAVLEITADGRYCNNCHWHKRAMPDLPTVDEKGRTCRLYGTLIALPQKSRRGNRRG